MSVLREIYDTFFGVTCQKCQHRALAKVIKNNTNYHVFDCYLVSSVSSIRYLPIKNDFFRRAQELKHTRIDNFRDVEKLIKNFDSSLRGQRLDILKSLYDRDHQRFIKSIKVIQSVASKYLCCMPEKLPLLVEGIEAEVSLSQFQIACILANFFFFNEPYKIDRKYENEYPNLNFRRLFISERQSEDNLKREKLKFLFSYFDQLNEAYTNGAVTFQRQGVRKEGHDWVSSNEIMTQIEFSAGKMEGVKNGYSEVDFANAMIGGGVLGQGAAQEEIRFLMSPELIVSRLFTERLSPTEAVVITGAQIFSLGEGYSRNFRFKHRYFDQPQLDHFNRRSSQIIAIDALRFDANDKGGQFHEKSIDRELNKALAGFKRTACSRDIIASGKWGCGAFNGDPYLKCFIQMMAATEASRNLVIYTFGDRKLCDEMKSVYRLLQERNVTIGKLYQLLLNYSHHSSGANICQFIQYILNDRERIKNTEINSVFEEPDESEMQYLIKFYDDGVQPKDEHYEHQFRSQNRNEYQNPNDYEIASTSRYADPLLNQELYENRSNFHGKLYPKIRSSKYGSEEQHRQYISNRVYMGTDNNGCRSQEQIQEESRFQNSNTSSYPNSSRTGYQNEELFQGRIHQNQRRAYPNNSRHSEINYGESDRPLIDLSDDDTKSGMSKYSIQRQSHYQNLSTMEYKNTVRERSVNQGIRYESGRLNREQTTDERRARVNVGSNIHELRNPIQGRYSGMNNGKYGNQNAVQSRGEYHNPGSSLAMEIILRYKDCILHLILRCRDSVLHLFD